MPVIGAFKLSKVILTERNTTVIPELGKLKKDFNEFEDSLEHIQAPWPVSATGRLLQKLIHVMDVVA